MLAKLLVRLTRAIARRKSRFQSSASASGSDRPGGTRLSADLETNLEGIVQAFGRSGDLVVRRLRAGQSGFVPVAAMHLDGLVDKSLLAQSIIRPITSMTDQFSSSLGILSALRDALISATSIEQIVDMHEAVLSIAEGQCVVLVDSVPAALACNVQRWAQRNPDEPSTEATVRGPKEGFVESLRVNTSMLRRRIADPRLHIEERRLGRITRTLVAMVYIQGIARPSVMQEVRSRLDRVDVDSIQESGQLEELIRDAPLSPFPTIARTERPDRVVGALLDGRIAIIVDGTPFVLMAPATFMMYLTTPEDYFELFYSGTVIRITRLLALAMSLLLPSFYVAVTTFHQEMLPTPLILSIAAQREGIPFPAFVEALIMEIMFELVREAGIRLPRVIGPAISIVGVLVLGDAAIRAGLVSPIMVIVVATTGIASLGTPAFALAISIRLLRFAFLALGASLGFFGIAAGVLALYAHLTALESFGVPYMSPIAPVIDSELKDTMVRAPWWKMKQRPRSLTWYNDTRLGEGSSGQDGDGAR